MRKFRQNAKYNTLTTDMRVRKTLMCLLRQQHPITRHTVVQAYRVGMLQEKFENTRFTHVKCSLHLTITYKHKVKHVSSLLKIVYTYVRNTDTSL